MSKLEKLQDRIDKAARKHGDVESTEVMKKLMNNFEADKHCGMYWRGSAKAKPYIFEAMTQDDTVNKILKKYLGNGSYSVTDEFASQLMVDGLCILQVALKAEFSKQEAERIEVELLGLSDVLADLEDNMV